MGNAVLRDKQLSICNESILQKCKMIDMFPHARANLGYVFSYGFQDKFDFKILVNSILTAIRSPPCM